MQAHRSYRSMVLLLAPYGFNAQSVWAMSAIEANAWIESILQKNGKNRPLAAEPDNATRYISARKAR